MEAHVEEDENKRAKCKHSIRRESLVQKISEKFPRAKVQNLYVFILLGINLLAQYLLRNFDESITDKLLLLSRSVVFVLVTFQWHTKEKGNSRNR